MALYLVGIIIGILIVEFIFLHSEIKGLKREINLIDRLRGRENGSALNKLEEFSKEIEHINSKNKSFFDLMEAKGGSMEEEIKRIDAKFTRLYDVMEGKYKRSETLIGLTNDCIARETSDIRRFTKELCNYMGLTWNAINPAEGIRYEFKKGEKNAVKNCKS